MEPNWLNEREARAWRGYQGMRISLGSHLARHMSSECLLTEAEFGADGFDVHFVGHVGDETISRVAARIGPRGANAL